VDFSSLFSSIDEILFKSERANATCALLILACVDKVLNLNKDFLHIKVSDSKMTNIFLTALNSKAQTQMCKCPPPGMGMMGLGEGKFSFLNDLFVNELSSSTLYDFTQTVSVSENAYAGWSLKNLRGYEDDSWK